MTGAQPFQLRFRMPRVPTPLAAVTAAASLVLVVAACTPAAGAPSAGVPDGGAAAQPTPADAAADWRTAPLTDVRSGETFTIDGLAGKLVAIEPMAIWCSNCRIQQQEAATALAAIASDDLVYVGLDVDPNGPPAELAAYSTEEGFDWPYAVAPPSVARSLVAEFGDQVLSPPSTPLILVGPDGSIIEQHFGIRRAAELEALFREHLP
jgi:hypothetical protein